MDPTWPLLRTTGQDRVFYTSLGLARTYWVTLSFAYHTFVDVFSYFLGIKDTKKNLLHLWENNRPFANPI